jgi:hypothetical protein
MEDKYMATYTTLRNGSSGDDVRKLQQALVDAGYSVGSAGVDGKYGSATAAAVKAYQQKNGLAVDGIAGNQTLGKLYGASTATNTTNATTAPGATAPTQNSPYTESEDVTAKRDAYDDFLNTKPDDYKSSYEDTIAALTDKIMNREKFTYDLNGDALYQQYKDQFINQGKLAMQDTMGQAAAMTGGYGNSYAQSVGQQTYQGYLQQLNDKVPELYQLALNQYNQEGEDMYNQYGLLTDRESTEYDRYRDDVADWNADRSFAYGEYRDTVSDSQWQAQFDESVRQFEEDYKLKVEEIEEAKRHNLISEDQAQQQINLAREELRQSAAKAAASLTASYIQAGFTKDAKGNWVAPKKYEELTDKQEDIVQNLTDNESWDRLYYYGKQLEADGVSEAEVDSIWANIPEDEFRRLTGQSK